MDDIRQLLDKLHIDKTGTYKNHFYIIDLKDSEEYAAMFTLLDANAINTEYPAFETNTNDTATKIVNYFEAETDKRYNIFLIGDLANDKYYLKIGEK